MPKRNVIEIDRDKCVGCGQCVGACHQGALELVDGKARLKSDDYCDGLGACIGECPVGALKVVEKDVPEKEKPAPAAKPAGFVCPGLMARNLTPKAAGVSGDVTSRLSNWPVQLALANPMGDVFGDTDILLAADCTAFACGGLHQDLIAGRTVVIACPKLDDRRDEYVQKLAAIFNRRPKSVTVARMEVPCCAGLVRFALEARAAAAVELEIREVVIGLNGKIGEEIIR